MSERYEEHDVLVAEDDLDDYEILGWALRQAEIPHILRHAENGDRLFILLKEKTPYILFLDIMMPCKNGLSCIMEIRKNREYDKLPIIMYSAHSHAQNIESAFRNSANFFLDKSPSPQRMIDNVKKIFSIDWKRYHHYPVLDQFVLS